jgi:predicted DNA-binding protein with PD1-like motif
LSDGSVRGGHFLSGIVRPTLEVVLCRPGCGAESGRTSGLHWSI